MNGKNGKGKNGKAAEPIFILAPIGSKGSVLAAALGRHPKLFAAPHLNLLAFDNLRQFMRFVRPPRDVNSHGLIRMLSWLLTSEQSIEATQAARRWLGRHDSTDTKVVHQMITGGLHPKRLVEYSPLYVHDRRVIEKVVAAAPRATFIHLVRHPSATAMEIARAAAQTVNAALLRGTERVLNQPCLDVVDLTDTTVDWQVEPPVFDPQFLWYRTHTSIAAVLAELPGRQVMRVLTEDLLSDPETTLAVICKRLRLSATPEVLSGMLRIGEDVFAQPGPFGTPGGVDWDLVIDPTFPKPDLLAPMTGRLPWRGDNIGYRTEVIALADQLGYRPMGTGADRPVENLPQ